MHTYIHTYTYTYTYIDPTDPFTGPGRGAVSAARQGPARMPRAPPSPTCKGFGV